MAPRKPKAEKNTVGVMNEPSITVPTLQISELPKKKRAYVKKVKPVADMYGGMDEAPAVNTVVPSTALPGLVRRRVDNIEKKAPVRARKNNVRVAPPQPQPPPPMTTLEKKKAALVKARAVRAANKAAGMGASKAPKPHMSAEEREEAKETMKIVRDMRRGETKEDKMIQKFLRQERGEGHVNGKKKFLKESDYHLNLELHDADGLKPANLKHNIDLYKKRVAHEVKRKVRLVRHLAKEAKGEVMRGGEPGEAYEEMMAILKSAEQV